MAGLGFCTALSCRRTTWLVLETNLAGNMPNKPLRKKSMVIRAEVDYVNAEEAKKLIAVDGYAVLDVRDKSQYDRAHIKSCYHVPLFIENKDNDLGTIINRTLHNNFSGLFYGLQFTKLNPTFVQSVKSQFSTDSKLLLVCQEGLRKGNLRFSEEHYSSSKPWLMIIERSMQGAVTAACISHDLRSAAASKKLEEAGFQNLSCITSGLQSVKPGTFDSVGSTELQNAGKAGLVTIQGKISAVLGTVLICAYLFITFFPEQAEKLLEMAPAS